MEDDEIKFADFIGTSKILKRRVVDQSSLGNFLFNPIYEMSDICVDTGRVRLTAFIAPRRYTDHGKIVN